MSDPLDKKREKKRKHNSDGTERPHKKRVLSDQPVTVKVSVLQDIGDFAPAIGRSKDFQLQAIVERTAQAVLSS